MVAASNEEIDTAISSDHLGYWDINKLTYRQLQKTCKDKGLAANGSTAVLRTRLLQNFGIYKEGEECVTSSDGIDDCPAPEGIVFEDAGDKDFDFNNLVKEIESKVSMGHWKAATRKLKTLSKNYVTEDRKVPSELYLRVIELCLKNRLQGARASEPARKILEEMAQAGYSIPAHIGNECVQSCLGFGPNSTHEGFGGIDTALAMLAALESSPSGSEMISVDTYGAVVSALSKEGAVDEAILLLRAMVVEHSFTPQLSTLADVAAAAARNGKMGEKVLEVMTLAKAAGYVLDSIASAESGRYLLASGVIAAEQLKNIALGLRLLTAASKAEGCAPDRGDILVATSSSKAQRACTIIHRLAIDAAFQDNNWKLAVKILQLMVERNLTPSNGVLKRVLTVCAKNEKSRRAVGILMDWVQQYEDGKAQRPPIQIFNTVVNACEICGEEELTLNVLETMKKIHKSEGNIVTSNIALKRLARQGNLLAVEGLIIGMLQAGIEPNVVTYTTAIGACVKAENSKMAYEWIKRMRSRNVMPNFHTYNTALAACLDKKFESTVIASNIASEMLVDVERELKEGFKGEADYKSVLPDSYTKVLARSLMKQLRENWRSGDINIQVAKSTLRVPLLKLVDFDKSETAQELSKRNEEKSKKSSSDGLDFGSVTAMAKEHRTMEV